MTSTYASTSPRCALRSSTTFNTLISTSRQILVERKVESLPCTNSKLTLPSWMTRMKSCLQLPFLSTSWIRIRAQTYPNWNSYWIRKEPSRKWTRSSSKSSGARVRVVRFRCTPKRRIQWRQASPRSPLNVRALFLAIRAIISTSCSRWTWAQILRIECRLSSNS